MIYLNGRHRRECMLDDGVDRFKCVTQCVSASDRRRSWSQGKTHHHGMQGSESEEDRCGLLESIAYSNVCSAHFIAISGACAMVVNEYVHRWSAPCPHALLFMFSSSHRFPLRRRTLIHSFELAFSFIPLSRTFISSSSIRTSRRSKFKFREIERMPTLRPAVEQSFYGDTNCITNWISYLSICVQRL